MQQNPLSQGAPRSGGVWQRVSGAQGSLREPWGLFHAAHGKAERRSRPISRVLSWTVIPLGASSPIRSSNLPGGTAGRGIASLFGLAPGGVCRAGPLPDSRCALTAPFHPCLISEEPSAVSFCCTFRRLAPPRRYLAPCPVEPGLSSASFPMTRLSGRLRRAHFRTNGACPPRSCGGEETRHAQQDDHDPRWPFRPHQRGDAGSDQQHVAPVAHRAGP